MAGQRDVRSPAADLSAAMAGGWTPPGTGAPDPEVAHRAAACAARREADEAREAERAAASAERRRRLDAVEALVAARTPVQRDADRRLFLETARRTR